MGAMGIFEAHIAANRDDPSGYHGWAESALFEIQENGNFDEKGNDRINEGQVAAYFKKAAALDSESTEYQAAYANALIEFDRIPMAIRELKKLKEKDKERDVRDDDRVDRCGAADGARDDGLLVPLDCLRGRLLRVVHLCGRLPLVRGGRLGLLVRAPPSLAVRAALLPQLRDALRVFLGRRVHRT